MFIVPISVYSKNDIKASPLHVQAFIYLFIIYYCITALSVLSKNICIKNKVDNIRISYHFGAFA